MSQVSVKTVIVIELDLTQRSFNVLINLLSFKFPTILPYFNLSSFWCESPVFSHVSILSLWLKWEWKLVVSFAGCVK